MKEETVIIEGLPYSRDSWMFKQYKQGCIATAERAVIEAAEKSRDCKGTMMQVDAAVDALRKARAL
jgi:hypothetical protein